MRALRDHPSVTFELEFLRRVIKIVIASALMAAGLYINAHVFNRWEGESGLMQIVELGILVVGGMLMYGFALMMLGVANLSDLKQNLKRS